MGRRSIDLTGKRFGTVTAMRRIAGTVDSLWECRCDCGRQFTRASQTLRVSKRTLCPCNTRHAHAGEYASWVALKDRCTNPRNPNWKNYGGRGIAVCEEWAKSFDIFLRDMGRRPPGTSIDRIDNDGNYEPGNCRWATPEQQMQNTRKSRRLPVKLSNPPVGVSRQFVDQMTCRANGLCGCGRSLEGWKGKCPRCRERDSAYGKRKRLEKRTKSCGENVPSDH